MLEFNRLGKTHTDHTSLYYGAAVQLRNYKLVSCYNINLVPMVLSYPVGENSGNEVVMVQNYN